MPDKKLPADGERFYSKRNTVTYDAGSGCVKKVFACKEDYLTEVDIYKKLAADGQIKVPLILGTDDAASILFIEFLEGDTLLELLDKSEALGDSERAVSEICGLLDWLDRFYKVVGENRIMQDVNFRNFVKRDDHLYGYDFESVDTGDQVRERCMVLAMYLLYDPVETDFKKDVCRQVIDKRGMEDAWACIDDCMKEVLDRRK